MAGKNLGKLSVQIGADASKLMSELKKSRGALAMFTTAAKRVPWGTIAAASAAAAGGLTAFATKAVNNADKIDKASKLVLLSAENFQAYQLVMDKAGVSQEQFTNGLRFMTRMAGEAKGGSKTAQEAFEDLGISMEQLASADTEKLLSLVADGLSSISDASEQNARAAKIFSADNQKMVIGLREGSDALRAQAQAAKDMGAVMSNEAVAKAAELKDKMTELTKVLETKLQTVLLELAPQIFEVAEKFAYATVKAAQFLGIIGEQKSILTQTMNLSDEMSKLNSVLSAQVKSYNDVKEAAEKGNVNAIKREKELQQEIEQTKIKYIELENQIARLNGGIASTDADTGKAKLQAPEMTAAGSRTAEADAKKAMDEAIKADHDSMLEARAEADRAAREQELEAALTFTRDLAKLEQDARDYEIEKERERADKIKEINEDIAEREKKLQDEKQRRLDAFNDKLADGLTEAVMTGEASFSKMAESIIKEIQRMIIKQLIFNALSSAFGGMGGVNAGPGKIIGQGGFIETSMPPMRAAGGPVSKGQSYLVGERGPEIFHPGSSGYMQKNKTFGQGVNMPVEVNITNNGEKEKEATVTAQPKVDKMVIDIVLNDVKRSGPITSALKGKLK